MSDSDETTNSDEGISQPQQPYSVAWPKPLSPVSVKSSRSTAQRWSRLSLLLVAALVGGVAGHFSAPTSNYSFGVSGGTPGPALLPSGLSIPALVGRVTPSIVSIDVKTSNGEEVGTGMIISSDGLVLTNNHVIAAAVTGGNLTVTRSGTTKSEAATLVGTDATHDVALIRISNVSGLPAVVFGNSDSLVTGDSVVAIGNALGLSAGTPTVTQGIVSALGRTVTAASGSSSETLSNLIQTDAAINPGNSGGPLLDSVGRVIGMNTAVAGNLPDGTNAQNIGFAIPIAKVRALIPSLLKGGVLSTHHAYLGVEIMTLTPSLAANYGFSVSSGAVIVSVVNQSAADNAGLQAGDVIQQIDSFSIVSAQSVADALQHFHPSQVVKIRVIRNNLPETFSVGLGISPN